MRITQALSLLYFLATSRGLAPDNNRRAPIRRFRTKNVFQRENKIANSNKLVYSCTALSQAAFIQPTDDADASTDVVVKTKRRKKVTAAKSVLLPSADKKQRRRRVEVFVSKSRQTLSDTTKVKSVETKSSRPRDMDEVKWNTRFEQLVEYKQQHGDCLVPQHFQENPQLGTWVKQQRQYYKSDSKTISEDHIKRLEGIGFVWDPHQAQWEIWFKDLLEYRQQHGDCLVPQPFRENPQLGQWVSMQRQLYKKVPKKISDDRIHRLENIGFKWVAYRPEWESHFKELLAYKQQHGDCSVPLHFQENPQLGHWVNYQRTCYKSDPKSISEDHIQRLEGIGFVWDPHQAQWEIRFKDLLGYRQQHGDCLVPQRFRDNPQLEHWVRMQRRLYKKVPKKISDDRIQMLNDIGFVWDVFGAQWELRFNQLVTYKRQHGDCSVPLHFQENPQLGRWVFFQRYFYRQVPKKISDERIQRLDGINFEWDISNSQ